MCGMLLAGCRTHAHARTRTHALPRHATPRNATPRHATPRNAMPRMQRHTHARTHGHMHACSRMHARTHIHMHMYFRNDKRESELNAQMRSVLTLHAHAQCWGISVPLLRLGCFVLDSSTSDSSTSDSSTSYPPTPLLCSDPCS